MNNYNLIMMNGYKSRSAQIIAENTNDAIFKSAGVIPSADIRVQTAQLYHVDGKNAREVATYDGLTWEVR